MARYLSLCPRMSNFLHVWLFIIYEFRSYSLGFFPISLYNLINPIYINPHWLCSPLPLTMSQYVWLLSCLASKSVSLSSFPEFLSLPGCPGFLSLPSYMPSARSLLNQSEVEENVYKTLRQVMLHKHNNSKVQTVLSSLRKSHLNNTKTTLHSAQKEYPNTF